MTLQETHPVGRDYLEVVSRLLQDARLAEPFGGLWEAADLQWWWRIDQHEDPLAQSVWVEDGTPRAASVFTRWKDTMGCDLLGTDAAVAAHADRLRAHIAERSTEVKTAMIVRDDDDARVSVAEAAGFVASQDTFVTAWMDVDDRLPLIPAPAGLRVESYGGGPHPMVARNGPEVAVRLAECPLYRPELDLAILDGSAVAGYALFWADPVTGVGLLEPMRIEATHQGRGLSKVLISAGLDRLAAAGCTRLKVSFDPKNEPARRLYLGAGYRPRWTSRDWVRAGVS